ncbi:MAG: hypothetical protein ACYDC3_08290 [Candidatus Binataceae bacterium]
MNVTQLLKSDDQTNRRAVALAALKQLCTYRHEDKNFAPGDAGYDPEFVRALGVHDLAEELNNALKTKNVDGLNALLDRWFSANLAYTPDTSSTKTSMTAEIRKLNAAIDRFRGSLPITTIGELSKRLSTPRPVGAVDARGLLA